MARAVHLGAIPSNMGQSTRLPTDDRSPPSPGSSGAAAGAPDAERRQLEDHPEAVLEAALEADLEALLHARPAVYLRRVPGRETFAWPAPGAAAAVWIVKRFGGGGGVEGDFEGAVEGAVEGGGERGGWPARVLVLAWGRLAALAARARVSPARREERALIGLAAAGLDVPRPLGVVERGARSVLAMEALAHHETLEARLARAARPERRRLACLLAERVALLHRSGWYHRDLYLSHWILVAVPPGMGTATAETGTAENATAETGTAEAGTAETGTAERGTAESATATAEPAVERLCLLDAGRARRRRRPRRRWLVKDLAALAHSAPAAVGPRERLAFLLRYLAGRGLPARAAPRWARAIERKRRLLAAHRPRHVFVPGDAGAGDAGAGGPPRGEPGP